jgi:hypothetical protein
MPKLANFRLYLSLSFTMRILTLSDYVIKLVTDYIKLS